MKKIIIAMALAIVTAAAVSAPSAQAQTNYPSVAGVTAFSPDCNYMSKPGYLRYRYFLQTRGSGTTGEFIDYETAARVVQEQGG